MVQVRCVHCGEVVGVYEPARLLLSDGTERPGSLLGLGELLQAPRAVVVHERCHEPFKQRPSDSRTDAPG